MNFDLVFFIFAWHYDSDMNVISYSKANHSLRIRGAMNFDLVFFIFARHCDSDMKVIYRKPNFNKNHSLIMIISLSLSRVAHLLNLHGMVDKALLARHPSML